MSKHRIDVDKIVSQLDPGTTAVDVVNGVGPQTAVKLHSANIKTAEQLSKCIAEQLVPLGIPKGTAQKLINSAAAMLMAPKVADIVKQTHPDKIVIQAPVDTRYTQEDVENARLSELEIEDYLALSPTQRARVVRLARMQVNVLPEDTDDDFAQDTNLGDDTAKNFLRKQRKKDQDERRLQKIRQGKAVTEFVEQEVHGHTLKDEPINVHGQRLNNIDGKAEGAPIDEIVIRRPKRKKTSKRGSDIVQKIVDNILD